MTERTPAARAIALQRDGFVVIDEALAGREVDALREETLHICRGDLGAIPGTGSSDDGSSDEEVMARFLCIHYPHKLSPLMLDILRHPAVVPVLTAAIGPDVKAKQSMLFIKPAGEPGQAWHQDESFISTRDRSLTAAWIALDDATIENGCLWVIPGSHRAGVLYSTREHDDPRFDPAAEAYGFPDCEADAVPVEVSAGSVVVFNGYLLHKSMPHTGSRGVRRAYVGHYMSARSLLPWTLPDDGGPLAEADTRDIVMIAGTDPYAHKGTTTIKHPYVRPRGR